MTPSHKALRPFSAHFPNFFTSNSITPDDNLHTFPHQATCHICLHIFIFSLQISFSSVSPFGKILLNQFLSGEGNGTPLQYSCLENPRDGGAWWAAVHGVTKSWTRLSDFTFAFTFLHWRRKWRPTPVFLSGESQGQGGLVGCRLWGCTESDPAEVT